MKQNNEIQLEETEIKEPVLEATTEIQTDKVRDVKNVINGLSESELEALSDYLKHQKSVTELVIKEGADTNNDKRTVKEAVSYVASLKDIKKSIQINKERRQKINSQKDIVKFLLGKNFTEYEKIHKVASKFGLEKYIESFEDKNENTYFRLHTAFNLNADYKPIKAYVEQLPAYSEDRARREILEDFDTRLNSRLNLISIQDKQIKTGTFKVSELQLLTAKQIEDSL